MLLINLRMPCQQGVRRGEETFDAIDEVRPSFAVLMEASSRNLRQFSRIVLTISRLSQAGRIAANIAKLPVLLGRRQTWGVR